MATIIPPKWKQCDHCKDRIDPGDELPVNRFRLEDETSGVVVEVYFPGEPDLHENCASNLVARPLKDWIGAPRTRATQTTPPAEASQPAPDAPKKSRKGAATNEPMAHTGAFSGSNTAAAM